MKSFIKLYSNEKGQIKKFLNRFFSHDDGAITHVKNESLEFQIDYPNPVIMSDIIGAFVDNKDDYKINMWICLDDGILINITPSNADDVIRYLFERYPY